MSNSQHEAIPGSITGNSLFKVIDSRGTHFWYGGGAEQDQNTDDVYIPCLRATGEVLDDVLYEITDDKSEVTCRECLEFIHA